MRWKNFSERLARRQWEHTVQVSCAPGGGFYVSIYGYTQHGQGRATHAFAGFARLLEIGTDGERLFMMDGLPTAEEAKILRRWLS